jgi:hypothetical protein
MSGEANSTVAGGDRLRFGSRYGRLIPIAEWSLLTALLAVFVGRGFLPGWRTLINSDFPNYYLAASLFHRGIPLDRVYEWIWFQRQEDYLSIQKSLVVFVPNPPMCVLPILPLSRLPPLAAKRAWLVINLGFLLLALWLLHRVTKLAWRRTALILLLCTWPLRVNFLLGQYYVLILLLICAAYYSSYLDRRFTSGLLLSAAASLKIFPALFLVLFIWKREWRATAGLVLGTAALAAISVYMFGREVHRILLIEVLPRALRGELVGPYSLQSNSFMTLWHHLFVFEPELNASPLLNSPLIYALAQAITGTALLFAFLWSTRNDWVRPTNPLEWAATVLLSLLFSSMPSAHHYCVLVFAGVVGMDELLKIRDKRGALVFILLFSIACAPPGRIARLFLPRLCGTLALYAVLLRTVAAGKGFRLGRRWLAAALLVSAVLTISNLSSLKNRSEDFRRRLANLSIGYSASNPVAIEGRIIFTELLSEKYAAMSLQNREVRDLSLSGDILSASGSERSPIAYFEQVTGQSSIVRLPLASSHPIPEYFAEGEQPRVSADGKSLCFIKEAHGRTTVWLSEAESRRNAQLVIDGAPNILDVSVTSEGDLIAAVGAVSEPHLVLVRRSTGVIEPLSGIAGPGRYPAISPDGKRLAFSRRKWGSWQLVVRELTTGTEQQLTHTACNATLPSWENDNTLLYATDCAREFGLSAIARVTLPN